MTRSYQRRPVRKSLTNEVVAVMMLAFAVLLLLSLITYDSKDPSWNTIGADQKPSNLIGLLGAYASDLFIQFFGLASFAIPILMALVGIRIFAADAGRVAARKAIGSALLLLALASFLALFPDLEIDLVKNSRNGGMIGYVIESGLAGLMNKFGAAIVITVSAILTLMLAMEVSLASVWEFVRRRVDRTAQPARGGLAPTITKFFERVRGWLSGLASSRLLSRQRRPEARAFVEPDETSDVKPRIARDTEAKIAEAVPAHNGGSAVKVVAAQATPEHHHSESPENRFHSGESLKVHREHTASPQQNKGVTDSTMDPEVAEMVSTASIVRTIPNTASASRSIKEDVGRRRIIVSRSGYLLPPLDLLDPPVGHREEAEEELRERATVLAEKCKEFSVTGHIHRINPGPVVTTFEFKPDPGIKYSRIVSLADDLCLALKAESVRIDRIPGKSTVGIEVPNVHREKICVREVIQSARFQGSESKLTIALGETINGEVYVADLAKMPHLLIAGATGAGKSVTLNSIICSILYKATPDEVKFIMVDPKRLELGLYEGIPHLLTPIVTEPKRAANALKWATNEMERRYRELAKFGVRNIDQYNIQVRENPSPTLFDDDPNTPSPLPYIVITIDELADLMMISRGDVETSIARLAQMARAVGIHLIVATQRPSVDVITGVIKANFPSRIAFRVSSKVDSRTIIDSNGAETLLGQGDMLFLPPASSRLIRVHGALVTEAEIKRITDHARNQAKPDYNETVTMSDQEAESAVDMSAERDELYDEALAIITDMGRASTSVLQRRLSIGYGRAAKILDTMEKEGFIGPGEGAKPRKVLPPAYEFRDRLQQRLDDSPDQ